VFYKCFFVPSAAFNLLTPAPLPLPSVTSHPHYTHSDQSLENHLATAQRVKNELKRANATLKAEAAGLEKAADAAKNTVELMVIRRENEPENREEHEIMQCVG